MDADLKCDDDITRGHTGTGIQRAQDPDQWASHGDEPTDMHARTLTVRERERETACAYETGREMQSRRRSAYLLADD